MNTSVPEIETLSEISPNKRLSGFAVILDTTRGMRVKNPKMVEYNTQLKLIDTSINPVLGNSAENKHLTFFLYWATQENQPFPYKIGDIFRFVNFEFVKFREYLQGKNKNNSTWCIYHGDSTNNEPYCQSSEYKEKMTQFHVQRLHELRQWTANFFQKYSLKDLDWYSYDRHLENPGNVQSFDMLLRIEEIRMPTDQTKDLLVTVTDDKLMRFQTHITAVHGRFLREEDIVKMRSIERVEGNYLKGHQKYFAVLGIPHYFRDYKEFIEIIDVHESQDMRKLGLIESQQENEEATKLYSYFNGELFEKGGILLQGGSILSSGTALKRKAIQKKTVLEVLRELEAQSFERILNQGVKYHIRATLIDIRPKSLAQCLRNECQKCGLLRRLDAPEGETCCQNKMEKALLMRFLWQDQSVKSSNKLLISYFVPKKDELVRCIFPDFSLSEAGNGIEEKEKLWEDLMEKYLEDDRLFDILLEPIDNVVLKERDGQVPLRMTETLFVSLMKENSAKKTQ